MFTQKQKKSPGNFKFSSKSLLMITFAVILTLFALCVINFLNNSSKIDEKSNAQLSLKFPPMLSNEVKSIFSFEVEDSHNQVIKLSQFVGKKAYIIVNVASA